MGVCFDTAAAVELNYALSNAVLFVKQQRQSAYFTSDDSCCAVWCLPGQLGRGSVGCCASTAQACEEVSAQCSSSSSSIVI